MKPQTISEKLLFNTVKLLASDGSSGTGFFYNFDVNMTTIPTKQKVQTAAPIMTNLGYYIKANEFTRISRVYKKQCITKKP